MIYSCFDQVRGLYDYYEGSGDLAINADLPIPRLPKANNKIGVPAIDAGRPMPADARKIGTGWKARGMVARCGGGMSGLGELTAPGWWSNMPFVYKAAMVAAGVGAAYGVSKMMRGRK